MQRALQNSLFRGLPKAVARKAFYVEPLSRGFSISSRVWAQETTETVHEKKPMTVNTELPDPFAESRKVKLQFAGFMTLVTIGFFAIVNYEKLSSPIIGSTLHFLRRSEKVQGLLGKNIDFTSIFPWISGEMNQVKGKINISFKIAGDNGKIGIVKLVADRPNKSAPLTVHEWSVTVDGVKCDILSDGGEVEF